jgi:hypothetical protein
MSAILSEIEYANVKVIVTERGQLDAAQVAERLSWGPDRLVAWVNRHSHETGVAFGPTERAALMVICQRGIKTSFADYKVRVSK